MATDEVLIRLGPEVAQTVTTHADQRGISVQEYIRQALATEVFFDDALADGYQVLLARDDKPMKEVLLRR